MTEQVWQAIRALTPLELATLAAMAGWNCAPMPLCGCRSPRACRPGER
jgi:hypothetical protein